MTEPAPPTPPVEKKPIKRKTTRERAKAYREKNRRRGHPVLENPLRKYREAAGYTVAQVSALTRRSEGYIKQLEQPSALPVPQNFARRLAKLYNVNKMQIYVRTPAVSTPVSIKPSREQ